jgi:hypothetical protein
VAAHADPPAPTILLFLLWQCFHLEIASQLVLLLLNLRTDVFQLLSVRSKRTFFRLNVTLTIDELLFIDLAIS